MKITPEQFNRYEQVRLSGVTNMFDIPTVEMLTGLYKEEILEIMKNYSVYLDYFLSKQNG